ncbi:hypothetical protein PILCRDRAFT_819994 [Piloderma croceum F 1598]|uniref:Uncharacterized protein n=1 Tax=Piloderma croceum (strain F 1598) TaxID=765440 RepID=A0A0C3FVY8_PILCF|nr:hypothetical protein PILCRDRAFT_819994 [Piloderma croceum F 1598]
MIQSFRSCTVESVRFCPGLEQHFREPIINLNLLELSKVASDIDHILLTLLQG